MSFTQVCTKIAAHKRNIDDLKAAVHTKEDALKVWKLIIFFAKETGSERSMLFDRSTLPTSRPSNWITDRERERERKRERE